MKLRIKLRGKLLGFLPIDWTYTFNLPPAQAEHVTWLTNLLWDVPVNSRYIKASLYALVEVVEA